MQFKQESLAPNINTIHAYAPGQLTINHTIYDHSVIITPDFFDSTSLPKTLAELNQDHVNLFLVQEPELILLGVGQTLQFPHPSLFEKAMKAKIGVEIMDTPAACRTYMILAGEGRRVIAGLLIGMV